MIKQVPPKDVPAFVRSAPVCILHVGPGTRGALANQVATHFSARYTAALGVVDVGKIDVTDFATSWWIHGRQEQLGWPASDHVRRGYYLFLDGDLYGFHPGLIDLSHDKMSLGFGAVAGLVGLFAKDPKAFGRAFDIAGTQAAGRVIAFFDDVIGQWQSAKRESEGWRRFWESSKEASQKKQRQVEDAELRLAFRTLGVSVEATRDDVKRAKKSLAKQWHPDTFAGQSEKQQIAVEQMTQINAAYDLIIARKGWQ
jgi:hypothetical protein